MGRRKTNKINIKKKIGYHYTSYKNWKKIRKEGLKPYKIDRENLRTFFENGVSGIWIWVKELKGISHAGSIIYQMAHKDDSKVVKLEIEYTNKDILRYDGSKIILYHEGNIENFQYHIGRETAYIITKIILPKDIKLIKTYNVTELLK